MIQSQMKKFETSRELQLDTLESTDPRLSFKSYLQNVERVVYMTFPDESRRNLIEDGKWRVSLLPQQFFWITFTAHTTLSAWVNQEDALCIQVGDLQLDGAPPELDLNNKLLLTLNGKMFSSSSGPSSASAPNRATSKCTIRGSVGMTLEADVPQVFLATPGLDQVSITIMEAVIKRMEQSLKQGLVQDYRAWVAKTQQDLATKEKANMVA